MQALLKIFKMWPCNRTETFLKKWMQEILHQVFSSLKMLISKEPFSKGKCSFSSCVYTNTKNISKILHMQFVMSHNADFLQNC